MSTTTAGPGATGPSRQVQFPGACRRSLTPFPLTAPGGAGPLGPRSLLGGIPASRRSLTPRTSFLVRAGLRREVARLDPLDDARVGEGGRVAEGLVLADVAEQPPHDLARPRLGQVVGEQDRLWLRDRADRVADVVAQLGRQRLARLGPAPQDDERGDGLARGRVRPADDGRLGDGRVPDERVLDLGGRDVVARDEHDVVDPPEQPVVAVLVALGAVTREVPAREPAPVRVTVALRV